MTLREVSVRFCPTLSYGKSHPLRVCSPLTDLFSIVDDDYNDVEPGKSGELILRGPMVTQGYYDNPKATEEAFHDGWFLTGDIGVMRNGKFYVVDRKKVQPPMHHLMLSNFC